MDIGNTVNCVRLFIGSYFQMFACLENERHMYIEYSGNIVPELV